MRRPTEVVSEATAKLRQQIEAMRPDPDSFIKMHDNISRQVKRFDMPGPRMADIREFNIPHEDENLRVRLYTPFGVNTDIAGPTVLFFHGGGFVACSMDSHDGIARRLANGAVSRVLSVDYRLAPEHPYPAGPLDCEAAVKWALSGAGAASYGIDPSHIALAGDSAGGNMAAFLAQKYRNDIQAQVLFYPLMQLIELKPPKPGPQDWLQLGFMALKFINENYVGSADPHETRLSPLLERDLDGAPPAYVMTCGLDPLRDEGKLYADNLACHGVRVVYHHEKAMPHGFLNFAKAFPKARSLPLDAAEFLRQEMPALQDVGA